MSLEHLSCGFCGESMKTHGTACKPKAQGELSPATLLGEVTLTVAEIRDLAQFAGMVINRELTDAEKEEERETEIVIAGWPTKGVNSDDGPVPPHKHIAYFEEYPEEGCCPLGSPNEKAET